MTIKEHCNLEDLYTQYVEDFEEHCKQQPIENEEDFDEYEYWYTVFTVLQAKKVALEEFAERIGYQFLKAENGYALALRGD